MLPKYFALWSKDLIQDNLTDAEKAEKRRQELKAQKEKREKRKRKIEQVWLDKSKKCHLFDLNDRFRWKAKAIADHFSMADR